MGCIAYYCENIEELGKLCISVSFYLELCVLSNVLNSDLLKLVVIKLSDTGGFLQALRFRIVLAHGHTGKLHGGPPSIGAPC
jgi:hypothetical protein